MVSGFALPFLDSAFYLGLLMFQKFYWRKKQILLLLVWGEGGHNKMSFRNCSFIVGKKEVLLMEIATSLERRPKE